jgi:predicted transcriptional regulator
MASRNYAEEVLTSPLAYKILHEISSSEEGTYPTKIAENLDSSYQSINNYMKGFRQNDMIEVSREDGKKKIYEINFDGLTDYFLNHWKSIVDNTDLEELKNAYGVKESHPITEYSDKPAKDLIEDVDNYNDRVFFKAYFRMYLNEKEDSKVIYMIYSDFADGSMVSQGAVGFTENLLVATMPKRLRHFFSVINFYYHREENSVGIMRETQELFEEVWIDRTDMDLSDFQKRLDVPSISKEGAEEVESKLNLN